ncbi:SusD/RagB family nutrient-binding outer membrane lipoprotein [Hwangdonia lutea]|uniref:SusD/RagB family nutrient-binding outer membrane lipoprotein n=1 Tax=Hwangdonia lutea TaxID=3075823 RepID=A0AA97EMG2_9FLAO|nr:SusD/RagB family nutrient-binding outer membrane lipoprotein [Hwangdonia sp. SCSIO 19198]WOD43882.1 SusD/RagB family nutrient-binding outer membrane lipoprotein [Hwangdonia sp. SCSIO 19198]
MKNIKLLYSLILLITLGSCTNFDDFQNDPNRTTKGDPSLLLTGIQISAFNIVSTDAAFASRQMVNVEHNNTYQLYGWQRSGFGTYNNLRQVLKMEEEATLAGKTAYAALGKFFRSYFMTDLTRTFGDVPYSEALKGSADEPIFTAKYDKQEDIYIGILDELDEANTLLSSETGTISGDLIYGGDLSKWRKAVNALSLRILMSLSKKEGNFNVGVVSRFNAIVNNPSQYPIFTSNDDNTALPYYDLDGNEYPYFNSNQIKTNYYMDESFINHLKDREDPRLFAFAQREENGANLPEDDFNAYGGLPGSDLASANSARVSQGEGSLIAERYYNDPVNEPSIAIGYAEVQFILAEAAARGWTSGDASEHYQNGIRASMQFYNIDSAAIDTYLANPQIVYNASQGIEMIITQKYLSFFMNSGWEAFYNQRRTGFPEFSTDGPGILNDGNIPKRWMYPESEIQSNRENLEAAINSQYPNGDTVNGDMWLLKNE